MLRFPQLGVLLCLVMFNFGVAIAAQPNDPLELERTLTGRGFEGFVRGGIMPEVEDDVVDQETPGLMLADKYYGAGCNWKLVDRGDGFFSLENQHFGGNYLDVDGDKRSLMLADEYGGAGCNWKLVDRGDGFFSLENQHFPGHYLDVVGGRRMLMLADKYDGRQCNWKKIEREDGFFSLENQHMEGCFLDVDGRFRR